MLVEDNHSKKYLLVVYVLIAISILMKLLYFDIDVPDYDIVKYEGGDEFYYCLNSINMERYQQIITPIVPFDRVDFGIGGVYIKSLSYLGMSIFGNNYYGIRFGVFLIFIISGLLLYKLTLLLSKRVMNLDQRMALLTSALVLLLFSFDFTVMLGSRIVEPSIGRMMVLLVTLYLAIGVFKNNSILKSAYFGAFIAFSIGYNYLNDAYLVLFAVVLYALAAKENGFVQTGKYFFGFLSGALIIFVVYNVHVYYSFDLTVFDVIRNLSHYFADKSFLGELTTARSVGGIKDAISHIVIDITRLNLLHFSTLLLAAFLVFIPYVSARSLRGVLSAEKIIVIMTIIVSGWAMFIMTNVERKTIILLPVMLLVVLIGIRHLLARKVAVNRGYKAYILVVLMSFSAILVFREQYVQLLFLILSFVAVMVMNKGESRKITGLVIILVILSVVQSGYSYYSVIVKDRTSRYKEVMVELAEHVDGKIVVFGYNLPLYNTMNPVMNPYSYRYNEERLAWSKELIHEAIDLHGEVWLIAYDDMLEPDVYGDIIRSDFELVKRYPFGELAHSRRSSINLYRNVP